MYNYLLLKNPRHSRVYLDAAGGAGLAELSLLLPGCQIQEAVLCGQPALSLSCLQPLNEDELTACAKSSLFFALFSLEEEDLFRPVTPPEWRHLPDRLNTILKYPGKTNEQFTRLLVNLAVHASAGLRPCPTLLDPMCGQGTTLFEAAIRGWNAVGLEAQDQPVRRGIDYFIKFLQTGRYKHKRTQEKRSQNGKSIAQAVFIDYAVKKDAWDRGDVRRMTFFHSDCQRCPQLLRKKSADLLACDLPYGVQHGSAGQSGLQRSAVSLVERSAPGWLECLRPGGGAALAYNRLTTPREQLAAAMEKAGFTVLPPLEGLEHRVDQAIVRDVLMASKP